MSECENCVHVFKALEKNLFLLFVRKIQNLENSSKIGIIISLHLPGDYIRKTNSIKIAVFG